MRILSVADLHYTLPQFDWLTAAADGFDLVILPGDFLDVVSTVDLDTQILVVSKYLHRLAATSRVLISSGNHDTDERNAADEYVAAWLRDLSDRGCLVDGDGVSYGGIRFTLCPWWDGEVTQREVGRLLEREAKHGEERWAWLYHAPPAGTALAWDGRREFGDPALLSWIERFRPDLVFAGHIHQAPFVNEGAWRERVGDTLIFNAGKQIGPVPAHIEIDTERNVATWRSLAGVETSPLFA